MLYFENDYCEGAHLAILQKLFYNILSIYILRHWYSPIF